MSASWCTVSRDSTAGIRSKPMTPMQVGLAIRVERPPSTRATSATGRASLDHGLDLNPGHASSDRWRRGSAFADAICAMQVIRAPGTNPTLHAWLHLAPAARDITDECCGDRKQRAHATERAARLSAHGSAVRVARAAAADPLRALRPGRRGRAVHMDAARPRPDRPRAAIRVSSRPASSRSCVAQAVDSASMVSSPFSSFTGRQ